MVAKAVIGQQVRNKNKFQVISTNPAADKVKKN